VNVKEKEHGFTALILASREGYLQIVRPLLKREDVDVNATDNSGCTALFAAIRFGRMAIVGELLKHDNGTGRHKSM
jgi:ankyrin repeat protein